MVCAEFVRISESLKLNRKTLHYKEEKEKSREIKF